MSYSARKISQHKTLTEIVLPVPGRTKVATLSVQDESVRVIDSPPLGHLQIFRHAGPAPDCIEDGDAPAGPLRHSIELGDDNVVRNGWEVHRQGGVHWKNRRAVLDDWRWRSGRVGSEAVVSAHRVHLSELRLQHVGEEDPVGGTDLVST